ncbi:MAG: winged helix-turn-helix transcriptional regulator [Gaiellaceae bacterium]
MRSYGQFCGVAKGLDLIGDRWTLLIVRELLIRGPARYTDLKNGLPGIATNLLADRLRELEQNGIVASMPAAPPVATTLFALTPRGQELEAVLHAIGRWGGALLRDSRCDTFQSHWLTLPLSMHLHDHTPAAPPATIEVRTGDEPLRIDVRAGAITVRPGAAERPDAVLSGAPESVLALLLGRVALRSARAGGSTYRGDPKLLRRIRPRGGF